MDGQDTQDGILSFGTPNKTIIGGSFEFINEFGARFLESVYEKALIIALRDSCFAFESQNHTNPILYILSIHVNSVPARQSIKGDLQTL